MPNAHCECELLGEDEICSEPIYADHNGKKYCALHYPDSSKKEAFRATLQARLNPRSRQYLKFIGVWFPAGFSFAKHRFESAADFSRASFQDPDFSGAKFVGYVTFAGATFLGTAKFFGVDFQEGASFDLATFEGGDFTQTTFSGEANFVAVAFKEMARFDFARFQKIADFGATTATDLLTVKFPFEPRRSRFDNASFIGTRFTQCNFKMACFRKIAQFRRAIASQGIDFSITNFDEADFSESLLTRANFDGAFFLRTPKFYKAEFTHTSVFSTARFPGADFSEAVFSGNADFSLARFEGSVSKDELENLQECYDIGDEAIGPSQLVRVSFDRTTFKDGLMFKASDFFQDRSLLTFDDAIFEKPERVKFQSVSMPPHSFMNVDPRKFHFADVRWGFIDKRTALREAKAVLEKHQRLYSTPILELAYRQLAVNAEENNRYEEAANLRYLAMEVCRLTRWRRIDWLRLSWWYWLLSGYGELVRRAFAALIIIWLTFAVIYWSWSDATWWQPKQQNQNPTEKSEKLITPRFTFVEALLYSGSVMALQKPEPLPANKRAKFFVLFETILGPVQGALLALAIRRKFMR